MSSGRRTEVAQEDLNVQDQNSSVLGTQEKQTPSISTSVPIEVQKNEMGNESLQELLGIYSEILNHNGEVHISNPASTLVPNGGVPAETHGNAAQNFRRGGAGSSNNSVAEAVELGTAEMVASSVSHCHTNTNPCSQIASNWMEPASTSLMLARQNSPFTNSKTCSEMASSRTEPAFNNLMLVKQYSPGFNQVLPVFSRYTQVPMGSNWIPYESFVLPMLQKQNFSNHPNQIPSSLYTQVGSNWMEHTNNLLLGEQKCISNLKQSLINGSSLLQLPADGHPVRCWPNHDVNSPPRSVTNVELSAPTSLCFAPLTPDKGKQSESQALYEGSSVLLDEFSSQEMEKQWNVVSSTSGQTENHPREFPQIIVDSASTCLLTPLKDRHNLDEIREQGPDSNKTPDLKMPKKRKHRPKVVKEGKPKSAQKSATPKTNVSDVSCSGKRRYISKRNSKTPESQHYLVENEGSVPTVGSSVKACRRALNFDLESAAGDACQEITDSHHEAERHVHKELFNSMSTISVINKEQPRQHKEYTDKNKQTATTCKITSSIEQKSSQYTLIEQSAPCTLPAKAKGHDAFDVIARNVNMTKVAPVQNSFSKGCKQVHGHTHGKEIREEFIKRKNLAANVYGARQHSAQLAADDPKESRGLKRSRCTMEQIHTHTENLIGVPFLTHENSCSLNRSSADINIGTSTPRTQKRSSTRDRLHKNICHMSSSTSAARIESPTSNIDTNKQMLKQTPRKQCSRRAEQVFPQQQNSVMEVYQQTPKKTEGKLGKHEMANSIEELIFQLEGLGINCSRDIDEQELHALVLYKGSRVIVPYEGFDNAKKHKARPKVHIDPETERIWNLLMRSDGDETAEKMDKDKEKWWEEERKIFHGRAESFIYRMRLVQGDRRFSRWKGSVVDSVIGVFLTQNVSDHLSSSVFMSLAATFPLQSAIKRDAEILESNSHILPKEEPVSFSGEIQLNMTHVSRPKDYQDLGLTEESLPPFQNTPTPLGINNIEGANLVKGLSGNIAEGKTPSPKNRMRTVEAPLPNQPTFSGNHPTHKGSLQPEKSAYSTSTNEMENSKNLNLEDTIVKESARAPTRATERTNGQQRQKQLYNRIEANANEQDNSSVTPLNERTKKKGKALKNKFDWDNLRKQAQSNGKRERSKETMDSLDYEAMRYSDVNKIANAIKERGLNNKLAENMKDFLNRLVDDHERIDLEWLRDAPPDKAKKYLLSFKGLGLKSVECVRLLTLHQIAFPVDTNVGRIAVRLGWVPLQPLPESLQLHLLELYPILESIQKYLWPRLCKLDQETLYELHYQLITFGKVFCTKNNPNCNACPLRGECRHFASAFASARLALPAPEEKNTADPVIPLRADGDPLAAMPIPLLEPDQNKDAGVGTSNDEPIVEEPSSPDQKITGLQECDIEDELYEDPDEIPTIKLNVEEFAMNLQKYMEDKMELQEGDVSRALVALDPEATTIPAPKLKNVSRLRTEHQVYELPDSHPLLEGMDKREIDDPSPYLLAIWTPGETADSVQPPEQRCESHESGQLCSDNKCFKCNSTRESNSQIVRGTLLIPCRTATRGSFPLNGTYFQVNEMFADHESSLNPIDVPRSLIWNLPRRTVYFGTSVTSIFRGLPMEAIQFCFWRGFVCVRGFDQKQRVPRPLMARLHFSASRSAKNQD